MKPHLATVDGVRVPPPDRRALIERMAGDVYKARTGGVDIVSKDRRDLTAWLMLAGWGWPTIVTHVSEAIFEALQIAIAEEMSRS